MKLLIVLSLINILGLSLASDVLDLTSGTFNDAVSESDVILVEFFAPWCGHCKKLAPEYETAATALQKHDPSIPLAKVDCTAEADVCQKFGVSGYPTLKIFRGLDSVSDYQGPRTADGIITYMKKQAGPTSTEIMTEEHLDKFINGLSVSVVGFFSEGSNAHKEYMKVANTLSETFRFGFTFDAEIKENRGYTDDIIIYRPTKQSNKFEDSSVKYEGVKKSVDISSFIKENALGLCGHMTKDNEDLFGKPILIGVYDVDYEKNAKTSNYWRNRIMKTAVKLNEEGVKMNYAIVSRKEYAGDFSALTFPKSDDPTSPQVLIMSKSNDKFVMNEQFSMEAIAAFVKKYNSGVLKPFLKSEPVPADNDGPVTVIVGETFEEIVLDDTKDVLIEMYAPWCGHCKKLAPVWDELGEAFKNDPNIVIAKMDATANDAPGTYPAKGFPTIFWAPRGKKDSPIKYPGGRELSDFTDYIKRETSFSSLTLFVQQLTGDEPVKDEL